MGNLTGYARVFSVVTLSLTVGSVRSMADELTAVSSVPRQPLVAATQRLIEALKFSGSPIDDTVHSRLKSAFVEKDNKDSVREIQAALDPLCLVEININAESRVKVKEGPVAKRLMQ